MIWKDLTKDQKEAVVIKVWKPDSSAAQLATDVARLLEKSSISRNSVIGVYTRNKALAASHPLGGFQPGVSKKTKPKPAKRDVIHVKSAPPKEPVRIKITPESIAFDEASLRIILDDLTPRNCRWPVNTPEPGERYLFCGHETEIGRQYCRHHLLRNTRPAERSGKAKRKP